MSLDHYNGDRTLRRLFDRDTFARLDGSRDFLAEAYAEAVSLEDAARRACLSPYHYHRLFTRTFGETPHDFLTRRRIERARELLIGSDLPVTEVCLEVGYSSLGTFSSRFHRRIGLSPSEYRRQARRYFPVSRLYPYRFVPVCFLRARWGSGRWPVVSARPTTDDGRP